MNGPRPCFPVTGKFQTALRGALIPTVNTLKSATEWSVLTPDCHQHTAKDGSVIAEGLAPNARLSPFGLGKLTCDRAGGLGRRQRARVSSGCCPRSRDLSDDDVLGDQSPSGTLKTMPCATSQKPCPWVEPGPPAGCSRDLWGLNTHALPACVCTGTLACTPGWASGGPRRPLDAQQCGI